MGYFKILSHKPSVLSSRISIKNCHLLHRYPRSESGIFLQAASPYRGDQRNPITGWILESTRFIVSAKEYPFYIIIREGESLFYVLLCIFKSKSLRRITLNQILSRTAQVNIPKIASTITLMRCYL